MHKLVYDVIPSVWIFGSQFSQFGQLPVEMVGIIWLGNFRHNFLLHFRQLLLSLIRLTKSFDGPLVCLSLFFELLPNYSDFWGISFR